MKLDAFLEKSWKRYVKLTPEAPLIHQLLEDRGETLINDHVAYRTFNIKGIDRLSLGRVFEDWGYHRVEDDLDFPEKKLKASYWIHSDPSQPKIFISELLVEAFPQELQSWVQHLGAQALKRFPKLTAEIFMNPTWNEVAFKDYARFYSVSEYASWTAAFGIQVNHFTVLVNQLKTFTSLQDLNAFLIKKGITLNEQGGIVKGTPDEYLEQSSTLAKKIPCTFSSGETQSVMGCYYEFAKRYALPGGSTLFQGFIPKSANKIFESNFESKTKPDSRFKKNE